MLLTLPLVRDHFVEVRESMSLFYQNEQTGAQARMGHMGAGFYVEAWHPDFALPLRKTYEWYQEDLATRDFEILRAVVGGESERRELASAR